MAGVMTLLQLIASSGIKFSLEDYQKNSKSLIINGKSSSTAIEPSIPSHTLVKLVDAEDITNEKKMNSWCPTGN